MTQEEFLIALANNQGNSNEVVGEDIYTTADSFPPYNNLYFPPSYNKGRPREGIDSLYNYDLLDAQTIDEQDDYLIPEEKKKNIFASIIDLMTQGGIGRVLADSFRNKVTNTPSMQAWRNFTAPQRTAAAGMYQPGGILQGYNPVSMFGKGPLGTLEDRRRKMLERQILGKSYSQNIMDKVNKGIEQLGGDRGPTQADLSAIGTKHFTGPGKAFAPMGGGVTGKGTKDERNYGGR
jgi:hypothetical protein